jgi:hypothetical protein
MAARIPSRCLRMLRLALTNGCQSGAGHAGASAVEQLGLLVVGRSAGEDGPQVFFALVGAPQGPAVTPDHRQGGG